MATNACCTVMRIQRLLTRRVTSLADIIRRGISIHKINKDGDGGAPSYVHGTGSLPLIGATIGQLLQQTTERIPDQEAVICSQQNKRLTFQQLLQQVHLFLPREAAPSVRLSVCHTRAFSRNERTYCRCFDTT